MNQVNYEYHCVAGPSNIDVKTERQRSEAVKQYQEIINREAAEGWEYVGIDEFTTTVATGCLGMGGPSVTVLKMLVFRRTR